MTAPFLILTTTFAAMLVAAAATPNAIKPVPVEGNISWIYSYADGQKLARETGKPMLVVFRCER